MERALRLAARGQGRVEPNPMVGAVIVKDGRVIGEGYHERFGGPHAEIAALGAARSAGGDPAGGTLYVTLEPCAHYGKTPPCAPAVAAAGLQRVVIATLDPLWRRHGDLASKATAATLAERGLDILARSGIETRVGLCQDEAAVLNAPFFKKSAVGLPLVIAKWAMSADGKIATRTGASRWISCAESRGIVHELRGRVDAIVVGSATARRDDPLLTCRQGEPRRTAARVVLCGRHVPPVTLQLVRTARQVPVLVAYPEEKPPEGLETLREAGCTLLSLPGNKRRAGRVDVGSLLEALARRDASSVLVEGGREVLGSFFDEGHVDRVMVFVAPFVIGGSEAVTAVGGRGVESISAAVPFVGSAALLGGGEGDWQGRTNVRLVGRDVLIEAWVSDPRRWAPEPERGQPAQQGSSR